MSSDVETSLTVRKRKASEERFPDLSALRSVSFEIAARVVAFFLLGVVTPTLAQESPIPAPSPSRTVRISFVPPPIEGTISLGIYDGGGKLVRVLHRESETDEFTIGHDALITDWDGKNDAGEDLPAGKYSARGYLVGALAVEGIDYFFNDWVTDENSPHFKHVDALSLEGNNLRLTTELASGENAEILYDPGTEAVTRSENVTPPADVTRGRENTRWIIANTEIEQLSPANEVLRRLAYQENDPQPKAIAASDREEKIFVLEESAGLQRIRGLTLVETKLDPEKHQSVSNWRVDFEKKIVAHANFSLENGMPVATGKKSNRESVALRLQPNPLQRDKPGNVELVAGFDEDGSYLKTSDGLPLRTISDTPNLSRALLVLHGDKAIDVFQDDSAVVEQYRISGADQMMAFDCGNFELK